MNDDAPVCPRNLYLALRAGPPDAALKSAARRYLQAALAAAHPAPLARDVPSLRRDLLAANHATGLRFQRYLAARHSGRARQYFPRRAHALSFLRHSAPTKLVDGAWLHGLLRYWQDPRYRGLVRIYLEELGEGHAGRNHVCLYQRLLASMDCDAGSELPARFYEQGALQLCLGWLADEFLPEVIGFNLGYEQLPLHLLITTHELHELGIDARYFSLHISIDNADTGHAYLATEAVDALLGNRPGDQDYVRLCKGFALNDRGIGAEALARECDLEAELIAIFQRKRAVGQRLHGPHCRLAGEPVSSWLEHPQRVPEMLQRLRRDNTLQPGQPLAACRFGRLLDMDNGAMAGVFSMYEQQLLADWLGASCDAPQSTQANAAQPARRRRRNNASSVVAPAHMAQAAELEPQELLYWMSPARHFTPLGLAATQHFCRTWQG